MGIGVKIDHKFFENTDFGMVFLARGLSRVATSLSAKVCDDASSQGRMSKRKNRGASREGLVKSLFCKGYGIRRFSTASSPWPH